MDYRINYNKKPAISFFILYIPSISVIFQITNPKGFGKPFGFTGFSQEETRFSRKNRVSKKLQNSEAAAALAALYQGEKIVPSTITPAMQNIRATFQVTGIPTGWFSPSECCRYITFNTTR
jgi:hypothetical protein